MWDKLKKDRFHGRDIVTVRELIEKLEYFPKELEVVDCRDDAINNVKQVEYYFNGVKNEVIKLF